MVELINLQTQPMIVVSFKMLFQFYIAQFVVTLVLCESLLYFTMLLWYIFVSKVIVFFLFKCLCYCLVMILRRSVISWFWSHDSDVLVSYSIVVRRIDEINSVHHGDDFNFTQKQ